MQGTFQIILCTFYGLGTVLNVREGESGMFRENSIETSILSRVKQITSLGWMHETGCMHWEDPEGWDGEGGGRGDWDGEHM